MKHGVLYYCLNHTTKSGYRFFRDGEIRETVKLLEKLTCSCLNAPWAEYLPPFPQKILQMLVFTDHTWSIWVENGSSSSTDFPMPTEVMNFSSGGDLRQQAMSPFLQFWIFSNRRVIGQMGYGWIWFIQQDCQFRDRSFPSNEGVGSSLVVRIIGWYPHYHGLFTPWPDTVFGLLKERWLVPVGS